MPTESRGDFDELSPSAMSPRALPERVGCPLPYGLSWSDVVPALPDIDPASIHDSRAYRAFEKQGRFQGSDSSCIVTIDYATLGGPSRTQTVFVKQTPPDRREAAHHARLASSGVPTPDLLAAVDVDGREVIVTEFLPTIGIDLRSWIEIEEMLAALARLNAIPLVADRDEPPPGRPRSEMDRLRRAGLAVLAQDPRTGVDVDRWFDAFDRLRRSAPPVSYALTHGEFSFQQCGWADRRIGRELVIFDLATMGRRARFADLASVLGPASISIGVREVDLLEIYLTMLVSFTGEAIEPSSAMTELVTYRVLNGFSALHWLTHDVYEPGSDELLDVARRLQHDLASLGTDA